MASLLKKLGILTLSNFHSLLDAAIDLNSIAAVKQYLRDLEGGISQLRHSVAQIDGRLRMNRAAVLDFDQQITDLNADIDTLLGDNSEDNDAFALPLEVSLGSVEERRAALQKQIELDEGVFAQLQGAVSQLQAKHASLMGELGKLESMEESRRSMQQASQAVEGALNVSVDTPDVDNVARRIQARYHAAASEFGTAMADLASSTNGDGDIASAQARLARRKAALAESQPAS